MIAIQFDNEADYFTIDPAAYAPALGEKGLTLYRTKLDEIAARLGPPLAEGQEHALWQQRATGARSWPSTDPTRGRLRRDGIQRRLSSLKR